jgi:hypothetical protein
MKSLLLLHILIAMLLPAQNPGISQGGQMTPAEVIAHVKQKDWRLVERPGLVGAGAGSSLLPLLDDPDPETRQLTVMCLNEAGGEPARRGLLKALRDKTETVSGLAARFLRKHYAAEDLPEIETELERSRDEYVREQICLLLGETGDQRKIPILKSRLLKEKDENARQAVSLALARLADSAARKEIIARLHHAEPKERVNALKDLPYVNDRSLLKEVVSLLDDTRNAVNMSRSHGPSYFLRVCDVAVNVANEILEKPFPWVEPVKRYSPEELSQAKSTINAAR